MSISFASVHLKILGNQPQDLQYNFPSYNTHISSSSSSSYIILIIIIISKLNGPPLGKRKLHQQTIIGGGFSNFKKILDMVMLK
jgi:hypothetical protein